MANGPGPLSLMVPGGFEQVVYGHDPETGLQAIIAVHSTVLGPALGGTRFWPYPDEGAALVDACRLAQGMTYKHAAAGLHQGGGKAVIIGDPRTARTDDLIRAYARLVDSLGGRYITAEDVGTTQVDMDLVATITPHVTGVSEAGGGSGDPSPATALGVLWAMRAVAHRLWGSDELAGRHVCISGVGKVGRALAEHLHAEGARLTVADVRPDAAAAVASATGAEVVDPARAHAVTCDIWAPCALGAVLDQTSIAELRCAAVVGSANNQLATEEDGARLQAAGVLYAPDYVVNAGGVINIAEEQHGYERARAEERIASIYDTTLEVLERAERTGVTPAEAADHLAEDRIATARRSAAARSRPDGPASR